MKEVTIHKFVCQDTVELRIQQLQQKKLDLADGVLTGAKRASKLTMDDLKMLFGLDEKKNMMSKMGAGDLNGMKQTIKSPREVDSLKYQPV